jgi:5-methylcytosine-specific restriction enzyme subunit McrC
MRTDVVLRSDSAYVVVEAKYYATPHQAHCGSKKLISSHLYQLLTYLSNSQRSGTPKPIGVLLYAGKGPGQSLNYELAGHTIAVRNLDLDRDWQDIHAGLIDLVKEFGGAAAATGWHG